MKKKKKLKKKFQDTVRGSAADTSAATTSTSLPRDRTSSPPHDASIIDLPSSTEKDTLTSKVIPGAEAGDSSEMDDLGEYNKEDDEDSKGKSSSDIFEGIGDIFPLPFSSSKGVFYMGDYASEFTSSKLLIPSHPSASELNFADANQGERLAKDEGKVIQH